MTAQARVAVAVVSVVFAIAGYAIGAHAPSRMHTVASTTAPVAARTPKTEATTHDSPPADTPLARYSTLEPLAANGNREAAAGLAEMLRPCALRDIYENEAVHFEAMLDDESDLRRRFGEKPKVMESYLKQADIARTEALAAVAACDGLTPEQMLSRGRWLYRAGELGDAASALEFGRGDFLRYEPLAHLDEVAFWRDHAESMLKIALAGGERDSVRVLAQGYDPGRNRWLEGPRFVPDPVSAYTYYLLASLTSESIDIEIEGALDRLDRELTDDERARARAGATEICMNDLALVCDTAVPGSD